MTDFEDRLTTALRSAADDAPDAARLAPAARRRAGVRRRRMRLASAAAVVAVVGVIGGVALLGSGDAPSHVATDPPSSPAAAPTDEGRVETWHDVTVTVPASWGHGSLSTWCIQGSEPGTPVVERPGGVVEDIACTPATGYGVRFFEGADTRVEAFSPGTVNLSVGEEFPSGSWQGWDQAGSTGVFVVAATRDEAEQVLRTFDRVRDVDGNGCSPRFGDGSEAATRGGQVRLCRYDDQGWLEQSEVLTGQDASDAVTALDAAPAEETHSCPMPKQMTRVEVTAGDLLGNVELSDTCQGFGWHDHWHKLTADVLYWVLSPGWSGQIPDGVTMDKLRK
jgi:hypothetical protein